jgi:hypothetical protein
MKTPIAFIIFNRPDTTEKVFEAIRQAKPSILLVIADGARKDKLGEAEKCNATRAIIDGVDWECEVRTNYSDVNLGCGKRVSSGIDWVFQEVEEAIILEDDCLPHPTFFQFCDELLEYYRHDSRIMAISGDNFQNGRKYTDASYYFSRYMHVWGWATWRRAWKHYDFTMTKWPEIKDGGFLKSVLERKELIVYWTMIFDMMHKSEIDTWDHQWAFACWNQNGLNIVPEVNLVSNIGFTADATHTKRDSPLANIPVCPVQFPLAHPKFVMRNAASDTFEENALLKTRILSRLKNKLNRVFAT